MGRGGGEEVACGGRRGKARDRWGVLRWWKKKIKFLEREEESESFRQELFFL